MFGALGNYDSGTLNAGYIATPLLQLPDASPLAIAVTLTNDVEAYLQVDQLEISLQVDGQWVALADKSVLLASSMPSGFSLDVSAFKGKLVSLVFSFNTVDAVSNLTKGPAILALAVPTATVCSAQATCSNSPGGYTCACNGGTQGDGLLCLALDPVSGPIGK